MPNDVRVKLFEIEKCGYYRHRSRHAAFCSRDDFINDLYNWVDGKSILETSTYEPTDEQDGNDLRTFCYNMQANEADDFLLTTWNETPSLDNAIASIDVSGQLGAAAIDTAEVAEGYVPGFPCYFWFPSGSSLFATVQIGSRLNGRSNLNKYAEAFLELYSSYAVLEENDDEDEDTIIGYSESGSEEDMDTERMVKPRFRTKELRTASDTEYLRQNVANIRRVIRKDLMRYQVAEDLALWQRLFRNLTGQNQGQIVENHSVSFELELQPSLEELNRIITKWEEGRDDAVSRRFDDVGFRIEGDQRIHWLSQAIASEVFELDLRFRNPPVANADRLLQQLAILRDDILAMAQG